MRLAAELKGRRSALGPRDLPMAQPRGRAVQSIKQLGNPELRLHGLVNRARWRQGT